MRPTIFPCGTSNDTPSSATMPPKRTDTLRTLSSAPPLASGAAAWTDCATMDGRHLPKQSRGLFFVVAPHLWHRSDLPPRAPFVSDCRTSFAGDIGATLGNGPGGILPGA